MRHNLEQNVISYIINISNIGGGFDILKLMPKLKSKSTSLRKILILTVLLILLVGVYLNRSYAHIFDYDKSRALIFKDIQRNYIVDNGAGTETIKYVVLGDSLSYGFGSSGFRGTFPYVLATDLLEDYKQVEVVNLAVSGAVIGELVEDQLPRAIGEKPGFVSIMIGTNDVHDFADKEEFRESLIYIIDELQGKTEAEILVINIPYLGTRDLILPPHDRIMDYKIQDFNKVIQEVSEEKQVEFFDLYSASKKPLSENPDKYYSIDEFHPSDEGYILWGDLINGN